MRKGRWIILLFAALTFASLWRTVYIEREKQRVKHAYDEAQQMVAELERQRSQLSGEVDTARKTITGQADELNGLQSQLKSVQDRLDKTVADLASLQREHEQLQQHDESLTSQVGALQAQKQQLEVKLSSLKELRLAIRDVKRKMRDERWAAWRAHIEGLKKADQERLASGNRGYVIREGTPTLGSETTLRVHVLQPQSQ